eukprot:TRINITY_DN8694_c0_g1_i1.p1 TRINITY_DN8694_c0_g1~~TRINITY_DN8694_c0_g1_i1.p1  ORF type:complete len:285 (+),score=40.50 TRINITY_DN8694_c0_g1_i1:51-905(+)
MTAQPVAKKEVVTGSATYEGETKNGMKHGHGTLTWDDGDKYVGEFANDEKTNGTFLWKGGDQYDGEWKNSLMHGKGTYTYRNGRVYEGEWNGGYKEGSGKMTWTNGDKYEGQYYKDYCHGFGVQTYADDRVYRGNWFENKKHGFGVTTSPNGEKTQGFWQSGQLNDISIVTEKNGKRYQEKWKNGIKEGERILLKRKDEDMRAVLVATEPPKWLEDSDCKSCYKCDKPFDLLNRRHHCRHCGFIFCGDCTNRKAEIKRFNIHEQVRVCDECFIALHTADCETNY